MKLSHSFSITLADIAWAVVTIVLAVATSYYSGICAAMAEGKREQEQIMISLMEENDACAEALAAHRGRPWILEKSKNGEYYVDDLD